MFKAFSLISILIFSIFVFFSSTHDIRAVGTRDCSFTIQNTSSIAPGDLVILEVTPDSSHPASDRTYRVVVTDESGNSALATNTANIGTSNFTLNVNAPGAPGNYKIGVFPTFESNPSANHCGIRNFTVNTNLAECGGLLGCTTNISVPNLRFSNPGTLIGDLITELLPFIYGIIGFITVIIIVISGIQFVLSSGNPEAAAAARGRLTFAVIGLIIVILAFAITRIIDIIFLGGSGVF